MTETTTHYVKPKQFNFNSVLGILCAAGIGFTFEKVDHINTSSIQATTEVRLLSEHVKEVDRKLDGMVTQDALRLELTQLREENQKEVDALKAENQKEVDALNRKIRALESHRPDIKP